MRCLFLCLALLIAPAFSFAQFPGPGDQPLPACLLTGACTLDGIFDRDNSGDSNSCDDVAIRARQIYAELLSTQTSLEASNVNLERATMFARTCDASFNRCLAALEDSQNTGSCDEIAQLARQFQSNFARCEVALGQETANVERARIALENSTAQTERCKNALGSLEATSESNLARALAALNSTEQELVATQELYEQCKSDKAVLEQQILNGLGDDLCDDIVIPESETFTYANALSAAISKADRLLVRGSVKAARKVLKRAGKRVTRLNNVLGTVDEVNFVQANSGKEAAQINKGAFARE